MKTAALLAGMNRLGYSASGIGGRELSQSVDYFEEIASSASFPFVSANLVRASDGSRWKEPYRLLEAGGRKIAVFGLTRFNPGLALPLAGGDRLLVSSPTDEARRVVAEVREEADLVILLAAMSLDDARLVASTVEGIDLVLGASDGQVTRGRPVEAGGTSIVYVGKQGQDLGEVRVHFLEDEKPLFELVMHRLTRAYPQDPGEAERVRAAKAEINDFFRSRAEARRDAAPEEAAADGRGGYLGHEGCTGCHESAGRIWAATSHAMAFQTLVEAEADFDPSCVGCHSVGYGEAEGFVDALSTPGLKSVQCEACHGPGASHAGAPEASYGQVRVSRCTGCHDTDNSPEFNYWTYWPRIQHGLD